MVKKIKNTDKSNDMLKLNINILPPSPISNPEGNQYY